jgi:hypothetical protein
MAGDVTTWHRGLIARWWSNFSRDGPEIEFFGRYVAAGQPAPASPAEADACSCRGLPADKGVGRDHGLPPTGDEEFFVYVTSRPTTV